MATYTPNKNILKPAYNEYSTNPTGWSGAINQDWDQIDSAFGGTQAMTLTTGTIDLTNTFPIVAYPSGGSASYIPLILSLSGTLTGNVLIRTPAAGNWIIYNNAVNSGTNTFTVSFAVVTGGSTIGTPIVLQSAARSFVYADSTGAFFISAVPAPNSITSSMFQAGAVNTAAIADGAVTYPKVAASAQATSAEYRAGIVGASFTGTIVGTALTVSSVTGTIVVGMALSGTGVIAGTTIATYNSGTLTGTVDTNYPTPISSVAMTATTTPKLLQSGAVWDSAAYVALSAVGTTVTPDFTAGYNFSLTLNGVWTLANPSPTANIKVGQSGLIFITEGATQTTTTFTGAIADSVGGTSAGTTLNVTSATAGTIFVGMSLTSGATGTIVSQTSGTAGGIGVYTVSTSQLVASTSITGSIGPIFNPYTYGSAYKFASGVKPTFVRTSGAYNALSYYVVNSNFIILNSIAGLAS